MTSSNVVNNVEVKPIRTHAHDFKLNIEEQVQRKIEHSVKVILKVELN